MTLSSTPEAPAPTTTKIYKCGTLRYTAAGLATLFFWLLWGDFFWNLLNTAIPGILPLKLNEMGASDTTMSLLVRTMGTGIVFVLCPIVSFKSDRYRSRWGRRIPFLLWSTPVVGLFMVLMGCFEDVTQFMVGDAQKVTLFGIEMSRMAVSLMIFGILLVGFDVFDIYNDTIYYYLFNDVVPPEFLARFLALFRIVGAGAGMIYNAVFMEHALTHFRLMWVLGGIGYTVAYLMMCFFVKEGQYPPPPENVDKGSGFISSLKTYFKECFYHRFYWYFFLLNTFFAVSWVAGGLFGTLRNTGSLELSLKELGMMGFYLGPIGMLLMYPAAWLADKYNPVRVYFWVTLVTVLSNAANVVFVITDFGPRVNLMFLYALSIVFMPFSALQGAAELPMYMRLLPKERYGQFCSANGMLRAFANIFFSVIAGLVIAWIGTRAASGYKVATNEIAVVGTPAVVGAAWTEEAVGPWEIKYLDNDARAGTITVPGATAVKVFFSEVRTQHGWDQLTSDAGPADNWSGNFDAVYSSPKSGDTVTLNVRSSMAAPGSFTITKVAYQGAKAGEIARGGALWKSDDNAFRLGGRIENGKAGVAGATVSFAAAEGGGAVVPAPVVTDTAGNWAQNGFVKGTKYTVSASKAVTGGTWSFTPPTESFEDTRGDIKFGGAYTDATGWTEAEVGPWVIKYQNNWDRTGTITVPGATAVKVYYDVFKTEPGVDRLSTNAEGDVPRSGNLGPLDSEPKAGETIQLRLTTGMYGKLASNMRPRRSGNLYNDYEVTVTKVKFLGTKTGEVTRSGSIWEDARAETFPLSGQARDKNDQPIPGAVVSFQTLEGGAQTPAPVISDARGHWCQGGFPRGGKFMANVAKTDIGSTWAFSRPTVGDMKYRYYPVWAMVFHIGAITCLILLYTSWKARGGDAGYTPPVLEGDVPFPPATPIVSLLLGFSFGLAGIADWITSWGKLDQILPALGWIAFAVGIAWLVVWKFTHKPAPAAPGGPDATKGS